MCVRKAGGCVCVRERENHTGALRSREKGRMNERMKENET